MRRIRFREEVVTHMLLRDQGRWRPWTTGFSSLEVMGDLDCKGTSWGM